MPSNARNLANLLGAGETTISAEKLGSDVAPGTEDYSSIDSLGAGTIVGETAFVEGSNRLYIWNGSGWYNIALINTTPTWDSGGQPAGSYVLDNDSPQDATVITLAASDPEGLPISYNYITSGQMDSIATISQDSSVFTITPKTSVQAPDGGTGSITFRATDGINILPQVSSFTLTFSSIVENNRYTTLLATATGTSDNNNITDTSSNNHTITVNSNVNSDAYAGTFSPYRSGGYSTYFDGNGDYLEVPQSLNSSSFGTGEFTVEFWFKPSEAGSTVFFIDFRGSANSGFQIFRRSTNFIRVRGLNQTTLIDGTISISDFNTWYHICVHRNSSNELKLFINGAQDGGTVTGHTTDYAHPTSGNWLIGKQYNSTSYPNGYMRDVRIIKGTAITPPSGGPTERLEAVTNTSLLTCHLPYITDGSSNDHSITINGNTSTKPFSPYDYTEYDAADHGGSVYFDRASYNSGACITVADHNDFTLGTSDWTVKFWVYHNEIITSSNNAYGYFSNYYYNTPGGFGLKWMNQHGNKPVLEYMNSGSYGYKIFDFVPSAKIWYYYELTCSSSTVTFKVNGETIGTQSVPDLGNPNRTLIVGAASNGSSSVENFLGGYIADFQYVIGGTASESSVPTAPMSTNTNAKLHIKGTDASIIDKSQGANLKLVGNTTGSTAQVKFANSKSIYSDGTAGNHISIPSDDSIFSKDYTIEFWMYPTQDTNLLMPFSKGVGLQFYHQSGNVGCAMSSSNSGTYFYNGNFGSITTNAWSHISLVRDLSASTYKFYINGILEDTLSSSTNINAGSADWIIAAYSTAGSYAFEGYIQDVRVTEGLTRYTANFTPPTAPLEG